MATSSSHQPFPLPLELPHEPLSSGGRFGWLARLVRTAVVLAVLTAIAAGGWLAYRQWMASNGDPSAALLHQVQRGDLLVTITEDGALESAVNQDIKCEVAGGSTILWIIPDGTQVTKDQELVRLDSANLEELVNQQQIVMERAQATRIESAKLFEAAEIAVEEYADGTYQQQLQICEAAITVALENLNSSKNSLIHAERMARKGYVTSLPRDAQAFAVQRAELDLKAARIARDVLEKFTRVKMLKDLEAKRDAAEAKMLADQAAYNLEETRLKRMKLAVEKCVITAPRDGMVIYANETSSFRGAITLQIEEGASVRERQSLIRLPDLSQMQVKAAVHESRVEDLRRGMRARILVQGREFKGSISSVATQPDPTGMFSTSVKKYSTIVSIEGDPEGLRPGMSAVVEILVDERPSVLTIPVQAVVEQAGTQYCWVLSDDRPQRRPLKLGATNNVLVEVLDGVAEREQVVLNPRAKVPEAREDVKRVEKVDVVGTFGKPTPGLPSAAGADGAAPALGNGPAGGERNAEESPGAPAHGGRRMPDFAQLDTDGDQRISPAEAPERMRDSFDMIDTDHDGFISAAELSALRQRFNRGPAGDVPGGGAPVAPNDPAAGGSL